MPRSLFMMLGRIAAHDDAELIGKAILLTAPVEEIASGISTFISQGLHLGQPASSLISYPR